MSSVTVERKVRWYQRPLHEYLINGGLRAIEIAHRRWGKDEIVLSATCELAHKRVGSYWHCLPEYEQGRKALWTAVNAHTGRRRIDEAFPQEICESRNDQAMFIRLKCGSTWQIIGSDRYDATVGARQPKRLGLPPADAGGEQRLGRVHHHAARSQPRPLHVPARQE
jgi:hypothetical protein